MRIHFAIGVLCLLFCAAPAHGHLRGHSTRNDRRLAGAQILPISGGDLSVATTAVTSMVGFMKERVDGFLSEVKEADAKVKEWQGDFFKLTLEKMPAFVGKVGALTVKLAHANKLGHLQVNTMKKKVDKMVALVELGFDGPNANDESKDEAIRHTRMTLKELIKSAATEFRKISNSVTDTKAEFADLGGNARTFVTHIDESIAGETAGVKRQIEQWRGAAYGTATAGVVACAAASMGAGVPICAPAFYATAAGLVETQVAELQKTLAISKEAVIGLANKFKTISYSAEALAHDAQTQFDNMSKLATDTELAKNTMSGDKDAKNPGTQSAKTDAKIQKANNRNDRDIRWNWETNVIPALNELHETLTAVTKAWDDAEAEEKAAMEEEQARKKDNGVTWCKKTQEEYGIIRLKSWGRLQNFQDDNPDVAQRKATTKATWARWNCDVKMKPKSFWSKCYSDEDAASGNRDKAIQSDCWDQGLHYKGHYQGCGEWKFRGLCE